MLDAKSGLSEGEDETGNKRRERLKVGGGGRRDFLSTPHIRAGGLMANAQLATVKVARAGEGERGGQCMVQI